MLFFASGFPSIDNIILLVRQESSESMQKFSFFADRSYKQRLRTDKRDEINEGSYSTVIYQIVYMIYLFDNICYMIYVTYGIRESTILNVIIQ